MTPKRIQRRRLKGWKMPQGAVYVGRPTRFGNPWSVKGYREAGYTGSDKEAVEACVEQFRAWFTGEPSMWAGGPAHIGPLRCADGVVRTEPPDVSPLRGRDLACWCPLDQPCHADVLLALANRPEAPR